EVLSDEPIQRNAFINAVSYTGCLLLGDLGFSKCGVSVLGFEDNIGIIKCRHTAVSETIAVLSFMTNVDGEPVIVRSAGVSGTVKGAETKYLKHLKPGD
ncbi:MAG: ribonuclease P, partial [Methanimicrococcus sp.]|nr:ribonuclease P [Methanimicrococcus sp.]